VEKTCIKSGKEKRT